MTQADHFFIEPETIIALSHDFTDSGHRLDTSVASFASRAENVDDAFGVMAESTDALATYVTMTQSTVAQLRQLSVTLGHYAAGLQQTATGYQAVDRAHAQQFGGRP